MDAFHFFGHVKPKGIRRENLFTTITRTLRIIELCLSPILLYWILTRLCFAVQISGDYFRRLHAFLGSPLFVFLIFNAIIAALLANSRRIIAQNSIDGGDNNVESQLYRELSKKSADRTKSESESDRTDDESRVAEEVEYQDKKIISHSEFDSDINITPITFTDHAELMDTCMDADSGSGANCEFPKVYRRSQSENLTEAPEMAATARGELRRSETERYGETTAKSGENRREVLYPQDKLSNEEFQRTIEAFIARQMRFLREESLAIVVKKQS